jgi:hypothetical protein
MLNASLPLTPAKLPLKSLPSPRETRSSTFDSASLAQSRGPREDVHSPRTTSASGRPGQAMAATNAATSSVDDMLKETDNPNASESTPHPLSSTFPSSMDGRQKNRLRTTAKTNIHAVPTEQSPRSLTNMDANYVDESKQLKSSQGNFSSAIAVTPSNATDDENRLNYNYTQSYKQLPPTPLNLSQKKNLLSNLDSNYTNPLPVNEKGNIDDGTFITNEWTLM